MTDPRPLYSEHLRRVLGFLEDALDRSRESGAPFDGVLFHSGRAATYHAQDREVPFQPVPHFARFAPLAEPDQLLAVRPGLRPRLVRVIPRTYWSDAPSPPDHPWRDQLEVVEVADREQALRELGPCDALAYLGDDPALAARAGIRPEAIEPAPLVAALDWHRATKTAYEVECIRAAARIAGLGHRTARLLADDRCSERQIHAAYLVETGQLETETPYTNIVAWDEHSAVLHYRAKGSAPPAAGASFLLDAGATALGYASDLTRSYAFPHAHPAFVEAARAMERLQRALVAAVRPGLGYVELHARAVRGVCEILRELGVLRVGPEEALERGLAFAFLPHGVGHHLGLQVHDVGGQQAGPTGGQRPPPAEFPYLRTTRTLEAGQVVTVEPGLYFIPLLLDQRREGPARGAVDWELVDALAPHGGIRIEDDVLVTPSGSEDLSRPFAPGGPG